MTDPHVALWAAYARAEAEALHREDDEEAEARAFSALRAVVETPVATWAGAAFLVDLIADYFLADETPWKDAVNIKAVRTLRDGIYRLAAPEPG